MTNGLALLDSSGLLKVEQARQLLAECKNVDEAKSIRDKALAIAVYLRQSTTQGTSGENTTLTEAAVSVEGFDAGTLPATPQKEIDRPGSREALSLLKEFGLWKSVVLNFSHNGSHQDEAIFTVVDGYRDLDKALRRKMAKTLWTLWSKANEKQQPDPQKCLIFVEDQYEHILAQSSFLHGGDIKLSDD